MKRTKAQRMLAAACGPALGVLLAVPVGGLIAGAAGADTTCYTGCTTPPIERHHTRSDKQSGGDRWTIDCGEHDLVEWAGFHRC